MKKAILLVAFGTTSPEAGKAFDRIDARTREAFPGEEIRWAFTSRAIRAKLAAEGKEAISPETALARLMDERFTHVAVLPLHVMAGREFHGLCRNAALFAQMAGGFKQVETALPLLSSHEDMARTARAMIARIPKDRKPVDAVLFVGHGNRNHPSDAVYAAMNHIVGRMDPNVHTATVEGYPGLRDILPEVVNKGARKVYLMPLMAVAGAHIHEDMAGDGPDSWKSAIEKSGLECEPILTGMGEYPEVAEIWLDHLRTALSRLVP